jgi:hypothetical protein
MRLFEDGDTQSLTVSRDRLVDQVALPEYQKSKPRRSEVSLRLSYCALP